MNSLSWMMSNLTKNKVVLKENTGHIITLRAAYFTWWQAVSPFHHGWWWMVHWCTTINTLWITWGFSIFNHLSKTSSYNEHKQRAMSIKRTHNVTLLGLKTVYFSTTEQYRSRTYESAFNYPLITEIIIIENLTQQHVLA
jgi:hypothetical protein